MQHYQSTKNNFKKRLGITSTDIISSSDSDQSYVDETDLNTSGGDFILPYNNGNPTRASDYIGKITTKASERRGELGAKGFVTKTEKSSSGSSNSSITQTNNTMDGERMRQQQFGRNVSCGQRNIVGGGEGGDGRISEHGSAIGRISTDVRSIRRGESIGHSGTLVTNRGDSGSSISSGRGNKSERGGRVLGRRGGYVATGRGRERVYVEKKEKESSENGKTTNAQMQMQMLETATPQHQQLPLGTRSSRDDKGVEKKNSQNEKWSYPDRGEKSSKITKNFTISSSSKTDTSTSTLTPAIANKNADQKEERIADAMTVKGRLASEIRRFNIEEKLIPSLETEKVDIWQKEEKHKEIQQNAPFAKKTRYLPSCNSTDIVDIDVIDDTPDLPRNRFFFSLQGNHKRFLQVRTVVRDVTPEMIQEAANIGKHPPSEQYDVAALVHEHKNSHGVYTEYTFELPINGLSKLRGAINKIEPPPPCISCGILYTAK